MMLTAETATWLADQIELDQWREYGVILGDVKEILDDLRGGKYSAP